ncbi:hypothetical protein PISMIDRAFT_17220, partial [Pisolithus microcarpus 441]
LALEDLRVEDHLKFLAGNLPEIQPLNLTLAPPSDELASVTHIEAKVGVGFLAAYNVLSAGQLSFLAGTAVTQHNLPMLTNVIAADGKSSPIVRGYFKHLLAPGSMNMETISQLESNHLSTESIISLPIGEEQFEFLLPVHLISGHVVTKRQHA